MNEFAPTTTLNPEVHEQPHQTLPPNVTRQQALERLLPYDYDQANQEGLIDMFYYDEKTGKDGLLHTLSGNVVTRSDGTTFAEGFHHEPSADIIWQPEITEEGVNRRTWVERNGHADLPAKKRALYKEYPLDPYLANVAVGGLMKVTYYAATDTESPTKNNMYPKEYDAFAVLRTIHNAYVGRDVSQDTLVQRPGEEPVYIAEGKSLLLDGKTEMPIRFMLDPKDKRIISAFPVSGRTAGIMKLNDDQAHEVVYGNI